jgi:serine phosphatase RsbU (regulator of sigma subunit)
MPKRKTKKTKSPVRNIKFSLRIKITLISTLVLIGTVALISQFIIDKQKRLLESQIKETTGVYLNTFKQSVEPIFIGNIGEKLADVQEFIFAYTNISNFRMAMFVDNLGYSVAHVAATKYTGNPYNYYHRRRISRIGRNRLWTSFEEKTHITNIVSDDEEINDINGVYPIYDLLFKDGQNFNTIKNYKELYNNHLLFTTGFIDEQTRNNNLFVREFQTVYSKFYNNGNLTDYARNRLQNRRIEQSDLAVISLFKPYFDQYKTGREIIIFRYQFEELIAAMSRLDGIFADTASRFLRMKADGNLFSGVLYFDAGEYSLAEEARNNREFINYFQRDVYRRYFDNDGELSHYAKELLGNNEIPPRFLNIISRFNRRFKRYNEGEAFLNRIALNRRSFRRLMRVINDIQDANWLTKFEVLLERGNLFSRMFAVDKGEPLLTNRDYNIRLMEEFNGFYNTIYENGNLRNTAERVIKSRELLPANLAVLRKYRSKFQNYRRGEKLKLTESDIAELMDTLTKMGLSLIKANEYITLVKEGVIFNGETAYDRDGEAFRAEIKNNLDFIGQLDNLYTSRHTIRNEWVNKFTVDPSSKIQLLADMRKYFVGFESAVIHSQRTGIYVIDDEIYIARNLDRFLSILRELEYTGKDPEEWAGLLRTSPLFTDKSILTEETKNNLRFSFFLERFIYTYISPNRVTTPVFDNFISTLEEHRALRIAGFLHDRNIHNQTAAQFSRQYTAEFRDHYREILLSLLTAYNKKISEYLYSEGRIEHGEIQKVFNNLYGFYRFGTVRFILDNNEIMQSQDRIVKNTIDIAVMVILRILVLSFIAVTLLIAPLSKLGVGTNEIGNAVEVIGHQLNKDPRKAKDLLASGAMDSSIKIKSSDEIGQLADRFNIMAQRIKHSFGEMVEKARMQTELNMAEEIQKALMPSPDTLPEIPGFKFSVYYEPESESGGDYYDFVENIDEESFGFIVADVTNHGVGAAMVMAVLRSAVRTAAEKGAQPANVIKWINPILKRDAPENMFATVFYGLMNHKTRELMYSIAGHEPGIIYNPDDEKLRLLQKGGMPVGIMDDIIFDPLVKQYKVALKKGDIFIQYSDGITEAKSKDDEEYGETRFYEAIQKYANEDIDAMRNNLIKDLKKFTSGAEQSDDITLFIMRVIG